ncbi:hypothetical protein B5M09_013065, partial [Aphanomyces astaci]
MVADAGVCAVVTTRRFSQTIVDLKLAVDVVTIDAATPKSEFVPSACHMATKLDEAYIVYTSGSTGKPKGVPVLHHSAVNSMERFGGILEIKEDSRVFQLMAIGFDGFQADMWESLSYGATLVMRSEDDVSALSTASNLTCTPTALSLLGDPNQYPQLKVVAVAGEACPVALKDLWAPRVKLFNLYGPSECAIMTHGSRLSLTESIAIGSVLANVHCYLLDDALRQVPFGILGEFYLSGICVSPGYINLPEMTEERFLVDPFGHGRMYKTGDLGRLLPNGQFEIAGRQDSQVKLKGYRIELDEVANAMMQHPSVKSAAAIVKDKTHLVGYFTPAHVNVDALRQCVADQLPVYMVPAVWVGLDDMPQNSNGKIDVKVLQSMDVSVDVETLETDVELKMATVWANVLGVNVSEIGRQSSFFALGGDSLSVVRVIAACKAMGLALSAGQLTQQMLLWRVAAAVTPLVQIFWPSAMVDQATNDSVRNEWPSVENWQDYLVYPVTALQAGMLYATLSNRQAYVLQNAACLVDLTAAAQFEAAFHVLVQRNAILRTSFVATSSGTYQVIGPATQSPEVATVAASTIADFWTADRTRGFELGDKSFVRLTIVEADAGIFAALTFHHAIVDGWSMAMMWDDLADLLASNQVSDRPSFHRVVDYVQAQDTTPTETFWRSYLSGVVSTPLGTNVPSGLADSSDEPVCMEATTGLSTLAETAQNLNVTVAELVKVAWAATVRKYTRQNDVVFGQVLANRDIPVHDADKILGPLVSTVPCRVQFDDTLSLAAMLECIRLERGAVSSHSHASLIDMKRWSGIEGDLFDSLLVYQNLPTSKLGRVVHPSKTLSTDHTLEIIVTPTASELKLEAMYNPSDIPRDQARWILEEFDFTLSQICCNKSGDMAVSELWAMSPAQTTLIRDVSSGPEVALPFELLHHAFETRAKARPHVRAVEIQDRWLSYGELDALANSVASDLAHLGVCVGSRVAVIMDRCLEFPIGLLAVLKVGAAMMPLDVAFPSARLAFMVADAGVCAVVTTSQFRQTIVDLELAVDVVVIDVATSKSEFVPSACHMATKLDEAYIVYTSGSTGKPKGVPVLHHSAVNSMERFGGILEIKEDSRVFQLMAIGFDGFQADMWESLSFGATLVLRSEDDLSALSTASNLTCTPTALSLLGEPNQYPQLKVVAVAGEACPVALKDLWAPRVKLFNLYGPSECAIMSHGTRLSLTESIAIGSVLPNVHCYVLDDNHRQVPFGILGEFYLSGICVSPGYINLPEMTEERFLVDPFGHGRMYKTGDLG